MPPAVPLIRQPPRYAAGADVDQTFEGYSRQINDRPYHWATFTQWADICAFAADSAKKRAVGAEATELEAARTRLEAAERTARDAARAAVQALEDGAWRESERDRFQVAMLVGRWGDATRREAAAARAVQAGEALHARTALVLQRFSALGPPKKVVITAPPPEPAPPIPAEPDYSDVEIDWHW